MEDRLGWSILGWILISIWILYLIIIDELGYVSRIVITIVVLMVSILVSWNINQKKKK